MRREEHQDRERDHVGGAGQPSDEGQAEQQPVALQPSGANQQITSDRARLVGHPFRPDVDAQAKEENCRCGVQGAHRREGQCDGRREHKAPEGRPREFVRDELGG